MQCKTTPLLSPSSSCRSTGTLNPGATLYEERYLIEFHFNSIFSQVINLTGSGENIIRGFTGPYWGDALGGRWDGLPGQSHRPSEYTVLFHTSSLSLSLFAGFISRVSGFCESKREECRQWEQIDNRSISNYSDNFFFEKSVKIIEKCISMRFFHLTNLVVTESNFDGLVSRSMNRTRFMVEKSKTATNLHGYVEGKLYK